MLDIGGPLLLTPFELRAVGERVAGLPPGSLGWTGPFDPGADPDWQEFQAGGMTERDYWVRRVEEFGVLLGRPVSTQDMMAALYGGAQDELLRPEALSLLRSARDAGVPVAALTNDLTSFHDPAWIARMTVLGEFDVLVDGRTEGVYKPDPRAYAIVLERLGVDAAEAVFVDDQPVNVRGAEAAGLAAVLLDVRSPETAFARARDLLGLDRAASA